MSVSESSLRLVLLRDAYSICRLDAAGDTPDWARHRGEFASVTRTADELSIVCPSAHVPRHVRPRSDGWRCLKVRGPLDLSMTGVLVRLLRPLADARCAVFPIATYETDHLLVRDADVSRAVEALRAAGHIVEDWPRHAPS